MDPPPSDDSTSSPSATDIITYIGVPLAVLGVLPILYNTAVTIAALSRIKRMLRQCKLPAITRSDVVNRVIEVELPRYAVTPLDRFEQRAEYWALSRHPSSIPGGSWTTFNWKTNTIGVKTQRVEYADQLRQPQVEVAFDELVCYLLDLGAVPDPHGWKLLRATGLWTPVGCSLMSSPDGQGKALTVAPLDDSDGNLSLAVSWSSLWTTRDHMSLPPYWVRLLPPAPSKRPETEETAGGASSSSTAVEEAAAGEDNQADEKNEGEDAEKEKDDAGGKKEAAESIRGSSSADSIQQAVETGASRAITCRISVEGLVAAVSQDVSPTVSTDFESLYIEHVRIRGRGGNSAGVWFASAATAYGTSASTVLWNYAIPDAVLAFARRETFPCGALVLLGIVDEDQTPEWATKYDDNAENLDVFMRRNRDQREAMLRESRMTPQQKQVAMGDRVRHEAEARLQDMRDRLRRDNQRRDQRIVEALQSPKWDARLVAERCLTWLVKHEHMAAPEGFALPQDPPSSSSASNPAGGSATAHASQSVKSAVGGLLHRMVREGEFATSLCGQLDAWRGWADNGGMRRADFVALKDGQEKVVAFAQASLLLAVIGNSTAALEGTLAVDLQECLKLWKKVRLG